MPADKRRKQKGTNNLIEGNVEGEHTVIGNNNVVIYHGKQIIIPSVDAIARHRVALRERLEENAQARWGGMSVYIREEGAALPIEASPYGSLGKGEDLLETIKNTKRLLVLGEPGSGKSVSLERLAWDLCGKDQATIPVLVPLRDYTEKLDEWVLSNFRQTDELKLQDSKQLNAFLDESGYCFHFLFDGLNEVAPPYRNRLIEDLHLWMESHPRHPVTITSRAQDELWRRLREQVDRVQMVQTIRDEQALQYLVKHLGKKEGRTLYGELAPRLREMARTPLILWIIKGFGEDRKAGNTQKEIPRNRGELFKYFVEYLMERDVVEKKLDLPLLESISDQTKITALQALAWHLSQKKSVTCSLKEAEQAMAQALKVEVGDQTDGIVKVCALHGLMAGDVYTRGSKAKDVPVRFAPHQTVQEHFAARALLEQVTREHSLGWFRWLWRALLRLTGKKGLTALAADDWWMETFVQLAGLTGEDDINWLALEVARVNPWLAWWCVEEGRGVTEETRQKVTKRSEGLLKSKRVQDRRRAVQILAQVHNKRVHEHLFQAAGDDDAEVAGLAVQALAKWSEVVSPLVGDALRGEDHRRWRAALRFLAAQPDHPLYAEIPTKVWEEVLGQPMVWIPPGPFLMGSDKSKDPQAYADEPPQHEVTLPGYWIGQCPVTVAHWRAFVEAGFKGKEESLKELEDHPVMDVSWDDAIAYCRWLSEKTGLLVTLPSEAEWEKAACGTDGRLYPWGDKFDMNKCNTDESKIGKTTPVGKYSPQGDSPYGCADMAGNVREWTRSIWNNKFKYPYQSNDGRENLHIKENRSLRGGSFFDAADHARCAFRHWDNQDYRLGRFGFRVVVSPVLPS